MLCLGLPLSASAQTTGREPPDDLFFGEEIDVRVVNVEAVVEDGDGNRVNGLTADDFLIFVDGLEVDIDYFTEILENRAVESGAGRAPPAIGDGESVPTNYLLFIDDDHTLASSRRPVLRGSRTNWLISALTIGWRSSRRLTGGSNCSARSRPTAGRPGPPSANWTAAVASTAASVRLKRPGSGGSALSRRT